MRSALGGPRLLLRRLREAMAEPVSAQARLDKIVVHIASNMVAEVCSVYVLRDDGRLELFATEGLNREAVHLTTMRSTGLVATTFTWVRGMGIMAGPDLQAFLHATRDPRSFLHAARLVFHHLKERMKSSI